MSSDTEPNLSDHSVSILLVVLNRVINDAIGRRLEDGGFRGLSAANDIAFEVIDPGGSRLTDMAKRARMTKQSMGEQVNRLERLGYMERWSDASDARAKRVALTPKGEAATRAGIEALQNLEAAWRDAIGEERAAAFRQTLADLVLRFGREHVR